MMNRVVSLLLFVSLYAYEHRIHSRDLSSVNTTTNESKQQDSPSSVYLAGVTYGGTGCSEGTVTSSFDETSSTLKLQFEEYIATTGPNRTVSDSRKSCQITIDLRYPLGWQYSYGSTEFRGKVDIPEGQQAIQQSMYYFAGNPNNAVSKVTFVGPMTKDYVALNEIDQNAMLWSDCGRVQPSSIKSVVYLTPGSSLTGKITVDEITKKVTQEHCVVWRKC
jgi:hypothetical protein